VNPTPGTTAAYLPLLALRALDATGFSVIVPVAPAIADSAGGRPATIGALVASFPAGMVAGFALAGRAVRRRRAIRGHSGRVRPGHWRLSSLQTGMIRAQRAPESPRRSPGRVRLAPLNPWKSGRNACRSGGRRFPVGLSTECHERTADRRFRCVRKE
jgi:hypothetical protein